MIPWNPLEGTAVWFAGGVGYALGNPKSRRFAIQTGSFAARSSGNLFRGVLMRSGPGFWGTTLVRGGTMTARAAAVQSTAAITIPLAVGYGVSYGIGRKMGYSDATSDYMDFVTGKVSPREWWRTVTLHSMRN
jgi:hypothetical protein